MAVSNIKDASLLASVVVKRVLASVAVVSKPTLLLRSEVVQAFTVLDVIDVGVPEPDPLDVGVAGTYESSPAPCAPLPPTAVPTGSF